MTAPLPHPTEEQMMLAYRQLARPHLWPPFLEACQHRVFGPCLRAMARRLNRPAWTAHPVAPGLPRGGVVPPDPPPPGTSPRASEQGINLWTRRRGIEMGVDWKMRQANDVE